MKHSWLEWAKTLLIALLTISLLLLFAASIPQDVVRSTPWLSTVLKPFRGEYGVDQSELPYMGESQSIQTAAQPLSITIRNNSGRYTAQWDFTALDTAYETLGGMLGQALDTSDSFSNVSQSTLLQALGVPSVCFRYEFSLPVSLVASWLDAKTDTQAESSMFVLALEQEQVYLYLCGSSCKKAATQVDPAEFAALLELFQSDRSQFAFEAESHLAPLSLLPGSVPRLSGAQTEALSSVRYVDALANDLGFNPYDAGRYTDSDGITHFSESGGNLEIGADGTISLSASTARITAPGGSLEVLVETARSLLNLAVDTAGSPARLYLSGITQENSTVTCTFDYVLRGIPVRWADGPAAKVVFSEQTVTELKLKAVNFTFTDQMQPLLPPAQVSAILPDGGSLRLQYHVSGSEVTAGWAK